MRCNWEDQSNTIELSQFLCSTIFLETKMLEDDNYTNVKGKKKYQAMKKKK